MAKIPFNTAYSPHKRHQIKFPNPSRTKQSEMDACDINQLMKRYERDGTIAHLNQHKGQYGDFLGIPEYQDALNQINEAQEAFNSLPAAIRKRFGNSPANFVDFAQNPENQAELVKMGLADPVEPEPEPYANADTHKPPSHEDKPKTASKAVAESEANGDQKPG